MRMRLFLIIIGFLCCADQSAYAQSRSGVGCVDAPFNFRDGITNVEAHTPAGQPCQIGLGLRGSNIVALEIIVRPEHGILGASEKEENRRYIAYGPHKGFAGHDHFEVFIRYTPPGASRMFFTRIKVEMNVTP